MTPSSLPDLEQLIASMLQGLLNGMKHPAIIKQTIVLDDSVQWSLVVARPLIEFTYNQNKIHETPSSQPFCSLPSAKYKSCSVACVLWSWRDSSRSSNCSIQAWWVSPIQKVVIKAGMRSFHSTHSDASVIPYLWDRCLLSFDCISGCFPHSQRTRWFRRGEDDGYQSSGIFHEKAIEWLSVNSYLIHISALFLCSPVC